MANSAAEMNALLGRGSEFEGKLTFEGTVRIDGKFNGEVHSEDTLIIGEGARVKAEISVANVVVYGDVTGNITATVAVELHAPARLKGNITAPQLIVDNGVVFDGNCQMSSGKSKRQAEIREIAAAAAPESGSDTVDSIDAPIITTVEPAIV
ncbi:MAG TPA: polymer-forming cytoskeletal protein [Myxococcales bacterium]|nr:polymer-forming cytoskeletal protein [Myxococcales bacterium]HIN86425.1 polymer-forming cytoskeletal protein [Myxococcales bacterium]